MQRWIDYCPNKTYLKRKSKIEIAVAKGKNMIKESKKIETE